MKLNHIMSYQFISYLIEENRPTHDVPVTSRPFRFQEGGAKTHPTGLSSSAMPERLPAAWATAVGQYSQLPKGSWTPQTVSGPKPSL